MRWLEIVLREESNAHTYRIGGDQFSILLTAGTILDHEELSKRIFARLAVEGEQLGVQTPAARLALIHYDDDPPYSMHDMIFQMGETMFNVKNRTDRNIHIESARNLRRSQLPNTSPQNEFHTEEVLRWIANDAIGHLFFMGKMLDHAQQASYLDAISGLPNMRAVLLKLEKEITAKQPFTVVLMDGDNTRAYNNVSYACGDEMIRKIRKTFWGRCAGSAR